jgi:hypothetical protein
MLLGDHDGNVIKVERRNVARGWVSSQPTGHQLSFRPSGRGLRQPEAEGSALWPSLFAFVVAGLQAGNFLPPAVPALCCVPYGRFLSNTSRARVERFRLGTGI